MTQPDQRTQTPKRKKRSRAETERKLIDIALDLIRNNGVLAGLNLREVAKVPELTAETSTTTSARDKNCCEPPLTTVSWQ